MIKNTRTRTKTKKMFTVLSILLVMGLFASQAFAWTISRDFEGGTAGQVATGTSGFDYILGIAYSNDIAHSGSRSVKCNFPQGAETEPTGVFWSGTANDGQELWYRTYFYFPSGFNWNNGIGPVIKVMRFTSNRSDNAHLSVFAGTSGEILLSNELGNVQTGTGVNFDSGRWQSVEFYVKLSSVAGKGVFRIWKDGILIMNDTKTPTLSAAGQSIVANHLLFNNWNNGSPKNQYAYVDDITITSDVPSNVDAQGNRMIGPTNWSTGSTVLPAPSGLRVTASIP